MRARVWVLAFALAIGGGAALGSLPSVARADSCAFCQRGCSKLPKFMRGGCLKGCRGVCSAAKKVTDTVRDVAKKVESAFERVKEQVVGFGNRVKTYVKTVFQTAEQIWNEVKNLRAPLIGRWSSRKRQVDLRSKMAEYGVTIKEQYHSTCMAHAMSTTMEYALIPYLASQQALAKKAGVADPKGLRVSRKLIYHYSRQGLQVCNYNKNPSMGSWALQAAGHLQQRGVCLERHWDFNEWDPTDRKKYKNCIDAAADGPPRPACMSNRNFLIDQFYYLPPVPLPGKASVRRASDVRGILARGYPVVVTVFTFEKPNGFQKDGTVKVPSKLFTKPDNAHYIALVGYDDARKSFILANSWGTDWGDKGFGYLPYSYLERYAIEGLFIKSVRVK
jgi:hypothetical protein